MGGCSIQKTEKELERKNKKALKLQKKQKKQKGGMSSRDTLTTMTQLTNPNMDSSIGPPLLTLPAGRDSSAFDLDKNSDLDAY